MSEQVPIERQTLQRSYADRSHLVEITGGKFPHYTAVETLPQATPDQQDILKNSKGLFWGPGRSWLVSPIPLSKGDFALAVYSGNQWIAFPLKDSQLFMLTSATSPDTGLCSAKRAIMLPNGAITEAAGVMAYTTGSMVVVGAPMKPNFIVSANYYGKSKLWIASGYVHRILDWGTDGATSPFIVESGALKIKTKKTVNGVTWVEEKITWESTQC